MQKIVNFLTSKIFLACLALILLALALWFIGPLLAFDNLKPLASVNMRVTVIVLMLAFALFALADWPVSVIGLTAVCLLIWHAGPLLRFGAIQPLQSETTRVLVICLLVLIYLVWAAYQLWKLLRHDPTKLDKILHFGSKKDEDKLAEKEIKSLQGIVQQAVAKLKKMRMGARGLFRLFEGKRYLYEVPWYMIIGNPGAGKTTAIVNSGLKFPLADQMGASALRDIGGTNNCTWWITNQAILIDTAGRYAQQSGSGTPAELNRAEWKGFLKILQKQRPRAPLNGVLVVISVADLMDKTAPERIRVAADLRARLAELREELGIRFPVYVMVTKMDLLSGFDAYFSTLTSDARNQVWGFTLPFSNKAEELGKGVLKERCVLELGALNKRLDAGINARLLEEFDDNRRRRMALLPEEFEALIEPLTQVVEDIFMDSRYDDTQFVNTLRGIYFTSAAQAPASLIIDSTTLWQRVRRAFFNVRPETENGVAARTDSTGNRSYFLHDLLTRLIPQETHLVRPNLRWEFRFRLFRLIGHTLALVIFIWLLFGVLGSSKQNEDYLQTVRAKNQHLVEQLKAHYAKPDPRAIGDLLDEAAALTSYSGLNPESPDNSWTYGLYSAPPVLSAGKAAYNTLSDRFLIPLVLGRIETVLSESIKELDEHGIYKNLRVYLLLHDAAEFKAKDVKTWLLKDWEDSDKAAEVFGGKRSIADHLRTLFDGTRVIQSQRPINETLVKQARALLDAKPSLTRLYERLKATMYEKAPEDFTLVKAIGPQVGAIFTLNSGDSLDSGVSGLFTYEGYHDLFKKNLPEFLGLAYKSDAWVMGRPTGLLDKAADTLKQTAENEQLATEIRRLYLSEYAEHWEKFLDDIRPLTGTTRAFNLQVVRSFAAPDSPLARLGKAVVKEVTLSRPLSPTDKSLLDKARDELDKKVQSIAAGAGRAEIQLEKQLVDNRFSALREIITGAADAGSDAPPAASGGNKLGMDSINGLINAYYTQLVIADNALSAQSIPPANDADSKLRMEIAKMPAPLQGILTGLVTEGMRTVNAGIGEILITQAEAKIGEFCRRSIEGKYPFAKNTQEVNMDDFVLMFASGGLLDEFFQKNLDTYVDSNAKPWRYKKTAPEVPPIAGPSLESFSMGRQIRDIFFRDQNPKKMSWKVDLLITELDPLITDFTLDLDGQIYRYAHGPIVPWNIAWPGARGGTVSEITANPRVSSTTSMFTERGPWAFFHLLEHGQLSNTGNAGKFSVDYDFDGRHAIFEVNAGSLPNPLTSDILKRFKCPGRGA